MQTQIQRTSNWPRWWTPFHKPDCFWRKWEFRRGTILSLLIHITSNLLMFAAKSTLRSRMSHCVGLPMMSIFTSTTTSNLDLWRPSWEVPLVKQANFLLIQRKLFIFKDNKKARPLLWTKWLKCSLRNSRRTVIFLRRAQTRHNSLFNSCLRFC